MTLNPDDWVLVAGTAKGDPDQRIRLAELSSWITGGLTTPTTSVTVESTGETIEAREALARCPQLRPARAVPFIFGVVLLPVALLAVHALVLPAGAGAFVLLILMAVVAAVIIWTKPELRARSPRELWQEWLRRRWLFAGSAILLVVFEVSAIVAGLNGRAERRKQQRDDQLTAELKSDPCSVEKLSEQDVASLEGPMRDLFEVSKAACTAAKAKAANAGACELLARHCDGRPIPPELQGQLSPLDSPSLAFRIASRKLVAGDLNLAAHELPCSLTPQRDAIINAFVAASATAGKAWAEATLEKLHPELTKALASGALRLEAESALALRDNIGAYAATIAAGARESIELNKAVSMCQLADDAGILRVKGCGLMMKKRKILFDLEAREERGAAARDAALAAIEARARAVAEQKEKSAAAAHDSAESAFASCTVICLSRMSDQQRRVDSAKRAGCRTGCEGNSDCERECLGRSVLSSDACAVDCANKHGFNLEDL